MGAPAGFRQHRGVRIGLWAIAAIFALLAIAQFLLPVIAVKLVRDRAARYGTIKSASISAFPAVELLWGKAESATLSAGELTVTASELTELLGQLWEARGVDEATVSAEKATINVGGSVNTIVARDLHAQKRGSELSGSATITQEALDRALPDGISIEALESTGGQVRVRASITLFGAQTSVGAIVKPSEGHLVVEPQGLPIAGLGTITLFSNPHLDMKSVAMEVAQRQPLTYRLHFNATLQ
jgi:hypothetical protein